MWDLEVRCVGTVQMYTFYSPIPIPSASFLFQKFPVWTISETLGRYDCWSDPTSRLSEPSQGRAGVGGGRREPGDPGSVCAEAGSCGCAMLIAGSIDLL